MRQNSLLNEASFISFARERGLRLAGVVTGEPSECHRRGWLAADGRLGTSPLFHPFRFYVLRQLLMTRHPSESNVRDWNSAIELAILMEPLYWPDIVGHLRYSLNEREHHAHLPRYEKKLRRLVRTLDPQIWQKIHECLRRDAAHLDENRELYVLLRLSEWEQREHLHGRIGGALWIRHLAEVIRRGFEQVHKVSWKEEDQAFEHWRAGARLRLYGADRPFDDPLRSKPFIAYRFGLFTGSGVRWYVEGETEYYAVQYLLDDPAKLGVELVNLRGEIAGEQRNAARKLEDALKEDLSLRRLSVISFDRDLKANERAVRSIHSMNTSPGAL